MNDNKVERIRQKVMMLKRQFLQGDSDILDQALGEQEIATAVSELVAPHRERIYPPLDTLRLFIGQVLSTDHACQGVVGRRLSERVAQGESKSALNTGSYCDARQRLPGKLPKTLGAKLGERLESMTPPVWRWQGRPVKLFDGTTVTMPDNRATSRPTRKAVNRSRDWGSPSPVSARSSACPAARCWAIKSQRAKAVGRANKVC